MLIKWCKMHSYNASAIQLNVVVSSGKEHTYDDFVIVYMS